MKIFSAGYRLCIIYIKQNHIIKKKLLDFFTGHFTPWCVYMRLLGIGIWQILDVVGTVLKSVKIRQNCC